MFRRFVRPRCKNLKTLCMFLIMLLSSKIILASSWCRQIWDVCGNKFFTCWRSTGLPWKSFFSLFPLKSTSEVSHRLKMQFIPIHTQRGGCIPFWIFNGQFDGIPNHFSVFFPLKSTSEMFYGLKMQFSSIHTQREGGHLISNFQRPIRQNSNCWLPFCM